MTCVHSSSDGAPIAIQWYFQPSSWRVVAGKNPAYDYFPCQYQLFYKGMAKDSMWYDPTQQHFLISLSPTYILGLFKAIVILAIHPELIMCDASAPIGMSPFSRSPSMMAPRCGAGGSTG
eukprot:scaffold599224_cov37-Prasinocladus_malaysianus.AAC.1